MNTRSVVTLALYVAANLVIAVLWHLVVFRDALARATPFLRSEPIIPLGMVAMVVQGVLLISIYPRFHRPASPKRSGALFGAAAGLFLAAGAIWVEVGKFDFEDGASYLVIESIYELASFAVLGLVLAGRHEASLRRQPTDRVRQTDDELRPPDLQSLSPE